MISPIRILVDQWLGNFEIANTSEQMASRVSAASILALAVGRSVCCLALPRRPAVYNEGKLVNQEYTVSWFHRMSFGWADRLLHQAASHHRLEVDDLDKLRGSLETTAQFASLERNRMEHQSLSKGLLVSYRKSWLMLLLLSFLYTLLGFGPQLALYKLLRSLESGDGSEEESSAWYWVGALGLSMVVASTVEVQMWWTMHAQLGLSVFEGLLALIHNKAMRSKDVKLHDGSQKESEEGEGSDTRTSVTNLAAVDARRITDFATNTYLIPAFVTKITVSSVMLVRLTGPLSVIAGLLIAASVVPLKTRLTRYYTTLQGRLMKVVDNRNAKISEMLGGMRQIKFTSMEAHWEADICHERDREMGLLRQVARCNAALVATSILAPVLLSVSTLTVYALLNKELLPSVAFTAISVLGSLETSFSSLPAFVSNLIDARVSFGRIQRFLNAPECEAVHGKENQISFKNAKIAWPVDGNHDSGFESRFVLRGLNIQFPAGVLSVIAGRTATGKSLLLTAVLGESDVLDGDLRVPSCPTAAERQHQRVNSANWILDTAVAYVAQNPWTENANVRQNILFGLPYDARRYRQATFAAALEQDWAILPDGDQTEIGANGINLSGGQKWRVSLARALYSRAGILVLDDIFSALDVHTGKHIYEHALTGPLGRNRTRILATHHTGLCFPRTDYCVLLDSSLVAFAGSRTDILLNQTMADMFLRGQSVSKEDALTEKHNVVGEIQSINEAPSQPARTFVTNESRALGSVPLSLYKRYFAAARRPSLWVAAGILHLTSTAVVVGRVRSYLYSHHVFLLFCC